MNTKRRRLETIRMLISSKELGNQAEVLQELKKEGLTLTQAMLSVSGFISITFSGNMGVIKTRPGYASSIAYNIDNSDIEDILGTIAGDDTIFIVIRDGADTNEITRNINDFVTI